MANDSMRDQLKKLGLAEDENKDSPTANESPTQRPRKPKRHHTPWAPNDPPRRPPKDPAQSWQWLQDIASRSYSPGKSQIQVAAMMSIAFGYVDRTLDKPNGQTGAEIAMMLERAWRDGKSNLTDLLFALRPWIRDTRPLADHMSSLMAETDVGLEFDRLDECVALDSDDFRTRYQALRRELLENASIRETYVRERVTIRAEVEAEIEREKQEAIKAEKIEHRRQLLQRLSDLLDGFTQLQATPELYPPSLTEEDVCLADNWYDNRIHREAALRGSTSSAAAKEMADPGQHIQRLLSARAGEILAKHYYQSLGCSVEDISLKQETEPDCLDWKTHDLIVDGQPVDVKNSRRSLSSARAQIRSYTEHTVAAFKQDRFDTDVSIAGIMSPYLQTPNIIDGNSWYADTAVYLGETSAPYIRALEKGFSDLGAAQLEFRRTSVIDRYFIPGWLFDFPKISYPAGADIEEARRSHAQDCVELIRKLDIPKASWPHQILVGGSEDRYLSTVPEHLWNATRRLNGHIQSLGLSRPVLFLWVLTETLRAATGLEARENFRPGHLYNLLLLQRHSLKPKPEWELAFPLGVADPLMTVVSLISALNKLWETNASLLAQFKAYRLVNHSILQGRNPDRSWKTLLAYCGGWKLKMGGRSISAQGKCGNSPLFLGDGTAGSSSSCRKCDRLICPECGHCDTRCENSRSRQERFARRKANVVSAYLE